MALPSESVAPLESVTLSSPIYVHQLSDHICFPNLELATIPGSIIFAQGTFTCPKANMTALQSSIALPFSSLGVFVQALQSIAKLVAGETFRQLISEGNEWTINVASENSCYFRLEKMNMRGDKFQPVEIKSRSQFNTVQSSIYKIFTLAMPQGLGEAEHFAILDCLHEVVRKGCQKPLERSRRDRFFDRLGECDSHTLAKVVAASTAGSEKGVALKVKTFVYLHANELRSLCTWKVLIEGESAGPLADSEDEEDGSYTSAQE